MAEESKVEQQEWRNFEVRQSIVDSLQSNGFHNPTEVQARSLVFAKSHLDMVIAARTGQGKTLCFGIPMLDLCIQKIERAQEKAENQGGAAPEKYVFDKVVGLIMSPTRELAIQIKDMIEAVIPIEHQDTIKVASLVGGMSIQKQQRLLSYNPAIIVATPGRLWELMNEQMEPFLVDTLPMIDVLVLDEADRMIADGHFKELRDILAHIYTQRLLIKTNKLMPSKKGAKQNIKESAEMVELGDLKEAAKDGNNFFVGKNLEGGTDDKVDYDNVKDLFDEDAEFEEMKAQGNIVLDQKTGEEDDGDVRKKGPKKPKTKSQLQIQKIEDENFDKEYQKAGGIQHIICSATMTIDKQGRITPRQQKKDRKQKNKAKGYGGRKGKNAPVVEEDMTTIAELCKILKFKSKHPKIIDLTSDDRMPETLEEKAIRCEIEEKDLYLYYYLQRKAGQSAIIFCNSITCTKRVASILDFLKVKNYALHSKMQQKQRLKSLDRFKAAVQKIENKPMELGQTEKEKKPDMIEGHGEGSILVCTDVAARGLDIPNVMNIIHYQSPFNAEIYVHRSGRTARIGKAGESLALLAPADEKNFKIICNVLEKEASSVKMLDVKYQHLEMLRPVVSAATDLEKVDHRTRSDEKAATQLVNMAKDAELVMDDDLKHEVQSKLAGSKRARKKQSEEGYDVNVDKPLFKEYDEDKKMKERNKIEQRNNALKNGYDKHRESLMQKRIGASSFLTPESARYLNEAIKAKRTAVDQEVVYAGLHNQKQNKTNFKRTNKNQQRFKNRTKRSQKKTNRHAQ